MLGGGGLEWLVKYNGVIHFVRDILLTRRIPLLGGGGLTNKTAMRVSSLLERKSSRGDFPCFGVGGRMAGKAQ